ncbi:hypothetical protein CPIN18021_0904 [Campylobacter pinnipediorum subsp. caledonicus]|uniref:Uncharacterized protein n=1 Tax=Campylobacter pinnipediorum subsp. caledonicus TaxID=1874362 RepID=A0A1S6U7M2_9BACT|nr:hypothetical protein [Campylobacter pinnipediorum]AQW86105.1 hypothetical protein CPIN18020_0901 [Campylobacter pinnipediorum subsp. caledonicus]AQW87713.1 hypothetical protein CPIN18021_0904 [Campylobacter pinnipediorum subsp. caledonicus]OPA72158.1 hypothetical protein BB381_00980 [Campylobacter pinnipediorum subsp. caledonicus]
MKYIFIFLFIANQCFAINGADIQNWFNNKNYSQVCSNAVEKFYKDNNDDGILNLYAISCLNTHQINRLTLPIFKLVKTKEARENAAYFADILFKKKLLYHAIIDGIDIDYIRLPKSDYILSMIFDRFVKKDYEKDGDIYIFNDNNSDTYYELGKSNDYNEIQRIYIKTYKNDELISEIEYW